MFKALVFRTLLEPEINTTFMDSVMVALSDKAFEKDITSWSDKEELSVKMLPAPETKTSLIVTESAKEVTNSMLGLSDKDAVSDCDVEKA